ncbi:dihydropteroate synthase [Granulicella sp. dw_53]|uniref:dihydropteroate synthase n=1 Tax=Granulicella sp. dw_53 TaxID=2719792 RepID=UPI001BD3E273|nr:dihydropteroate synthase [Granulicella sp. dw_53]
MPFLRRTNFDWRLRTRTLVLGSRTLILAILNVTPDSFSDAGHFFSPEKALDRALHLLDEGADILDLGGESTRPNASPISPDEEQSRALPILEAILKARPEAILSIDTFHASTAKHAIEAGAEIVNDVSGHTWDPAMSSTCAALQCGAILMHTRGTPQTWQSLPHLAPEEILPLVLTGLTKSVASTTAAGIPRDRIVLDPGFGFGKLGQENYTLLARLEALHALNLPILVGLSRKGFLTKPLPQPASSASRLHTTLAANIAAILAGAHLLRVHDPAPAREAALIADATLAAI